MEVSRRKFIKTTAGAAGLAATSLFSFKNLKPAFAFGEHPQEKLPYRITKKIPQVCARACEANCAYNVVVGVDPVTGLERAITLEGREKDPVSRGKYCIKGMGFVDSMYDPDRLMVTLKRTNPKKGTDHDPGWIVMDTHKAADEFVDALKKYKREEILMCSPGDPYTNRLCQSAGITRADQRTECFGTHYYINCLTVTNPPNAYYSSTYTPSHHICGYDYSGSKYELWFGFDSLTKASKAGILNHIVEGKKKGTKRVMLNPVRSTLADCYADEFYSVKPGTDLSIALAIIKTITEEGIYNRKYLSEYTDAPALVDEKTHLHAVDENGKWLGYCTQTKKVKPLDECKNPALDGGPFTFEFKGKKITAKPVIQRLREAAAGCTAEKAEKLSGMPAADIKRVAREYCAAAPRAFCPALKRDPAGPNYANSWKLRHCINILNMISGGMDHEGGVLLLHDVTLPWLDDVAPIPKPYPAQPAKPVDSRNEFPVTWDIYKNRDYSAPGHYGMAGFGLYHGNTTKVVFFRNPHRGLYAFLQPQMVEKGLEKMDLVADWNLYLDDLGYWCDYVFAAGHQFEGSKLDLRLYYPKWPCLAGGLPVQKSPGDQIGWGTLAKKMGLALAPEYWTTDGSSNPEKFIKDNRADVAVQKAGAGKNFKDFIRKGGVWVDKKPYENWQHIRKIGWNQPNGRLRIYVDEFVQAGYEGVPRWSTRWYEAEGEYRFSTLFTRAPWLMHADPNFINSAIMKQLTSRNFMDCIWINPEDAKELGVKEGDQVVLETNPTYMKELPRPVKGKIHLSKRVRRDCTLLFHGLGHRAKNLRHGRDWGYRDSDLVPRRIQRSSKNTTHSGWDGSWTIM